MNNLNKKILLGILTVSSLSISGCKTKKLTNTEKSEVFKISDPVKRGEFKIGYASDDFMDPEKGFFLDKAIKSYTQDIEDSTRVGAAYYSLPNNLHLKTSQKNFKIDIQKSNDYTESILELQKKLYAISLDDEKADISASNYSKLISLPIFGKRELYGQLGMPSLFVKHLFATIKDKKDIKINELVLFFIGANAKYNGLNTPLLKWTFVNGAHDTASAGSTKSKELEIKFASVASTNTAFSLTKKTYNDLIQKTQIKKTIVDNVLNTASYSLDSLFINSQEGIVNNEDFYKDFITKNNFVNTKVFLIGKNSEFQSGNKNNKFASGNISSASFNKYLASYTTGFQTAISQINYNEDEREYEKTNVSFFIGSTTSKKDKWKANAFKKGVLAASTHTNYAPFLNVKFVDKSADDSEKNKKLYYSIENWKEDNKISHFISDDKLSDADQKVIYLAGSTISDWTGSTNGGADNDSFEKNENSGLIGSIYKYDDLGATTKSYGSKKLKLILDQDETQNVSKIGTTWTETDETDKDALQRHNINVLGFIGGEAQGVFAYTTKSIAALYLGGEDYMLGNHTLFGSMLDFTTIDSKNNFSHFNQKEFYKSVLESFDLKIEESDITF